jgi:hypothetical protein
MTSMIRMPKAANPAPGGSSGRASGPVLGDAVTQMIGNSEKSQGVSPDHWFGYVDCCLESRCGEPSSSANEARRGRDRAGAGSQRCCSRASPETKRRSPYVSRPSDPSRATCPINSGSANVFGSCCRGPASGPRCSSAMRQALLGV